jgi:hypothetical protein
MQEELPGGRCQEHGAAEPAEEGNADELPAPLDTRQYAHHLVLSGQLYLSCELPAPLDTRQHAHHLVLSGIGSYLYGSATPFNAKILIGGFTDE